VPLLRDVMTAILIRFEWHDDVRSQKRARLLYRPLLAANHRSVQQGRAQPLVSYRVIVDLISATTTKTGLTVRCELDTGQYPSGIVVSDAEMAAINIKRAEFHGEWNYTISPNAYLPDCAFIS
jgi:DDE family transposase